MSCIHTTLINYTLVKKVLFFSPADTSCIFAMTQVSAFTKKSQYPSKSAVHHCLPWVFLKVWQNHFSEHSFELFQRNHRVVELFRLKNKDSLIPVMPLARSHTYLQIGETWI